MHFRKITIEQTNALTPEKQRLIESLRVVLAIISGLLLLDMQPQVQVMLSMAVAAFSLYAVTLLWMAAQGASTVQRRMYYWLDACWFLLLLFLAGEGRTHFFMFLFFPVFFVVWRVGYWEGVELAVFSGLAAVVIFALGDPNVSWVRLLALPLSLIVVCPIFMALTWIEAGMMNSRAFAKQLVAEIDARRGFDAILPDIVAQVAARAGASEAILAMRTFNGLCRVFCWDTEHGSTELSANAAPSVCGNILSLGANVSFGLSDTRTWWKRDHLTGIGSSGATFSPSHADRDRIAVLAELVGQMPLITVPMANTGIGEMRLLVAGKSLDAGFHSIANLAHVVEQVVPSVENTCLREQLATEAANTERARIGRDLHDSALQPYIGLKFALEALQRRAGTNNPIAGDLARLLEMASAELAEMREVISGLRGEPGKGGALLSEAVRRQASRFEQLFGIQVDVDVEGDMPVSRRIAGELFHIIAEGLSNIRRHTKARRAWISLHVTGSELVLGIRNENRAGTSGEASFTPSSMAERAAELGGSVQVDCDGSGTTVTVRVPITDGKAREQ